MNTGLSFTITIISCSSTIPLPSSSSSSLSSASSSYFPPPPALFFEALQDALVKLPKKLRALYPVSCISWALKILGETQD